MKDESVISRQQPTVQLQTSESWKMKCLDAPTSYKVVVMSHHQTNSRIRRDIL